MQQLVANISAAATFTNLSKVN